jgi:hypothetical protein
MICPKRKCRKIVELSEECSECGTHIPLGKRIPPGTYKPPGVELVPKKPYKPPGVRKAPPTAAPPEKEGLLSATVKRLSAYVCATCGAPLIEENGKYRCRGKYCPLSGYRHDKEYVERMHRRRIMRLAIGMILSIIPLIFPGGPAGLAFMFGIWCLAFEFYFPFKPQDTMVMWLKGIARFSAIFSVTGGFYLLKLYFLAIIALAIAYFTLPTGIAEIPQRLYNMVLGGIRTAIAVLLAISIGIFIGGPAELRWSLALFTAAFFITIPSFWGELFGEFIFIAFASGAIVSGIIALGAEPVLIGVIIIIIGLIIYGIVMAKTKIEQAEEERRRKEEELEYLPPAG